MPSYYQCLLGGVYFAFREHLLRESQTATCVETESLCFGEEFVNNRSDSFQSSFSPSLF